MSARGIQQAAVHIADVLPELLREFKAPIRHAFAYGSAAFPQSGYSNHSSKPMVDLIFGVTHPEHWHSLNLQHNRHHYSALGSLGSAAVATVQEARLLGAGLYFNPFVNIQDLTIKYGVISIDRLCTDLAEWETMYMAGRLHKPIHIIRPHSRVALCQYTNRINAVRAALLLLPSSFSPTELYHCIASLSYLGDFRMRYKYLENPHKVYNMVYMQGEMFESVYRPIIEEEYAGIVNWNGKDDQATITVDDSVKIKATLVARLPKQFLERVKLEHKHYLVSERRTREDLEGNKFALSIAHSPHLGTYIRKSLYRTISLPALTQAAKGILTAGLRKTMKYASAKVRKGIQSSK